MPTNGPTGVPRELRIEYRRRLRLLDPSDPQAAFLLWVWFAREAYERVGHPLIFQLCETPSKERALRLVFAFIREQIGPRQLYDRIVDNIGYALNLQRVGIIPEDFDFEDPTFMAIRERCALECVAVYWPMRGMTIDPENWDCNPIIDAGIPIWHRYRRRLHILIGAPDPHELRLVTRVLGRREEEILASGDYSANSLTPEQLAALRAALGL